MPNQQFQFSVNSVQEVKATHTMEDYTVVPCATTGLSWATGDKGHPDTELGSLAPMHRPSVRMNRPLHTETAGHNTGRQSRDGGREEEECPAHLRRQTGQG